MSREYMKCSGVCAEYMHTVYVCLSGDDPYMPTFVTTIKVNAEKVQHFKIFSLLSIHTLALSLTLIHRHTFLCRNNTIVVTKYYVVYSLIHTYSFEL